MRAGLLLILLALVLPAPAQAHGVTSAGRAFKQHADQLVASPTTACPAGVPVQTITVVNEAHASPWALAKVENAIVEQSLELRAAWGTPCVQFGGGGWPLSLEGGDGTELGVHSLYGQPSAIVWTNGLPYVAWSQPFSHEVIELLVDPLGQTYYTLPDGISSAALEVADPVGERAYRLDSVWVSDFALPAYYAGAQLGICATQESASWCESTPIASDQPPSPLPVAGRGPLIAPAGAPGPYDEMRLLTAPWSTT